MTVRYGPDERLKVQAIWRHPAMFRSELHDYLGLDRLVEDGALCDSCAKPLRYPLVEVTLGGWDFLMHPECAEETGRGLLDDVGVIGATRSEQTG